MTRSVVLTTLRCSIDKPKALSLLVHCADISHPAKNWNLHSKWTNLLVEEFFKQVFQKSICIQYSITAFFMIRPPVTVVREDL